mmetsp:Transcript_27012/g.86805  ORF Transcript_27012/g.86805 Transcript_27012/m.86805 type:complete len:504 (+) Transcript_27012:110-1621(+)|eukprot:CAMPEP_0182856572 /NCGR_PEP_ID=MMETSP0034_2-20130328/2518_1 /TAXON_ID=156128 /ORGANISM="Nephroselmis pyriformis, Strain CCMP717" /LENGTH=503 /DNA_ID=CAMNT_0024987669 /DNA_START=78 /DNA_END=1589 /DNA_ORIENTATION=+
MKDSINVSNCQMKPLAKLIPSLLAGVVIATLSASVTAKPMALQTKTPAQVEQALTALLNSRDANIQLASYTSTQASNQVGGSLSTQAPVSKVDHSGKSVSELILAGLAITGEAKKELASTASSTPKPAPKAQDYAVADIVNVEELEKASSEKVASLDATLASATVAAAPVVAVPVAAATTEEPTSSAEPIKTAEEELPALPAHLIAKDQEIAETESLEYEVDETNVDSQEFAESDEDMVDPVEELVEQLATTSNDEAVAVEAEAEEFAETYTEKSVVDEVEVEEIAETYTEEATIDEVEVVAETYTEEATIDEVEVVAETYTDEATIDEVEVEEIAATYTEETVVDEVEVEEVAETYTEETVIDEVEEQALEVAENQSSNEEMPDYAQSEPVSAPVVDDIGAEVSVAVRSAGCPENFNKVSIPLNGKMCQIFAADFPASMILFVPQTPEEVIKYYLASSDSFIEPKLIKQRTMLKSADNNTTLIISKDGGGTQVDILVKSPVT